MKTKLQLIIFLCPFLTTGQGFLPMDTLDTYPVEITSKITGPIQTIVKVDFNGDQQMDYVVTPYPDDSTSSTHYEYWMTSDFKIFKKHEIINEGHQYYRFVNLDDDPEPEIYSASGYEDGIDYAFYNLNLSNGKEELIFYFNPVLEENGQLYWGYPWDVKDIKLMKKDSVLKVYASIDHDILRDGNITIPENQSLFPAIFFTGHSTQPEMKVEEIRKSSWMEMSKIQIMCVKK